MLIRVLEHGALPPLTRLEEMVLAADVDYRLGIDEACENVRVWLRAEVDRRLREGWPSIYFRWRGRRPSRSYAASAARRRMSARGTR